MHDSLKSASKPMPGTIGWIDLTTENADQIKDFYQSTVGWSAESVPVKNHKDYIVSVEKGQEPVAGICHRLAPNAEMPSGWMIYIHVESLKQSLETCVKLGGAQVGEIRNAGDSGEFCVIRDPAGSHCVLIES